MKKLIMICCVFFAVSCSVNNEDDLNRFEIQKLYQLYVDDFIANDFESIASYFDTPVDLKSFNDIAETNEDVILFFKDLKANIQEGYAYSVIDNVSVTNVKDDTYLFKKKPSPLVENYANLDLFTIQKKKEKQTEDRVQSLASNWEDQFVKFFLELILLQRRKRFSNWEFLKMKRT